MYILQVVNDYQRREGVRKGKLWTRPTDGTVVDIEGGSAAASPVSNPAVSDPNNVLKTPQRAAGFRVGGCHGFDHLSNP